MARRRNPRLEGFAPVIDARCETLILGSFPSRASLAAGHYYAHPRNQFWPIVGAAIGESLVDLAIEARYPRLLAHRIALWDVIAACERSDSLDASIRSAAANEFGPLLARGPMIRRVLFNGGRAGRLQGRFADAGFETVVLPSTSPAFATMRIDEKRALWSAALRGADSGSPRSAACAAAVSGQ
ncbi:MAG: DNA-deoxyinosine glycosylase [Burkholderiaceae bacterium]|nr:DNA-deoxyinosine glycosylase [Burkholderiaceae bacterium]